jgi:hypothetical protein
MLISLLKFLKITAVFLWIGGPIGQIQVSYLPITQEAFCLVHQLAADGETHQEALSKIKVIIQEWLETAKELGGEIPEPKGRLVIA